MSYLDFLIRKEYAFLKNTFDEDNLKQSNVLCTLENYWQMMKNYTLMIKTAEIELQSVYHLRFRMKLYRTYFTNILTLMNTMRLI